MKPTAEDLEVARSIMEQFVDDEYLATKLGLEDAIASAIATEREKAAKIAEMKFATGEWGGHYVNAGIGIAAAIRAGDKE